LYIPGARRSGKKPKRGRRRCVAVCMIDAPGNSENRREPFVRPSTPNTTLETPPLPVDSTRGPLCGKPVGLLFTGALSGGIVLSKGRKEERATHLTFAGWPNDCDHRDFLKSVVVLNPWGNSGGSFGSPLSRDGNRPNAPSPIPQPPAPSPQPPTPNAPLCISVHPPSGG